MMKKLNKNHKNAEKFQKKLKIFILYFFFKFFLKNFVIENPEKIQSFFEFFFIINFSYITNKTSPNRSAHFKANV
jgi:hypothetical protein